MSNRGCPAISRRLGSCAISHSQQDGAPHSESPPRECTPREGPGLNLPRKWWPSDSASLLQTSSLSRPPGHRPLVLGQATEPRPARPDASTAIPHTPSTPAEPARAALRSARLLLRPFLHHLVVEGHIFSKVDPTGDPMTKQSLLSPGRNGHYDGHLMVTKQLFV